MYCNNCGRSLPEGQRFCTGCGKEVPGAKPLTCEKCGAALEDNVKFCNICGTPVKVVGPLAEKRFCPYCGEQFKNDDAFCKQCGQMREGKRTSAQRPVRSASTVPTAARAPMDWKNFGSALTAGDNRRWWVYLVMAACFVLCIILIYVPMIKIDFRAKALMAEAEAEIGMSLGAPLSDPTLETVLEESMGDDDLSVAKAVFGVIIFVACVCPLIVAALLYIIPLVKKTYAVHRRMICPKIITITTLCAVIVYRIVLGSACKEILKELGVGGLGKVNLDVGFTFGGVIVIILLLAMAVFQFWYTRQTKKAEAY